ncbi:MAG: hypothetical protein V3V97_22395, partial [Hyphomicrobiaceae bacterium]
NSTDSGRGCTLKPTTRRAGMPPKSKCPRAAWRDRSTATIRKKRAKTPTPGKAVIKRKSAAKKKDKGSLNCQYWTAVYGKIPSGAPIWMGC